MPWIKFVRGRGGRRTAPPAFVSITKHGVIGFSVKCCDEFNISDYKYGILYYDSDRKRIGIEFTNDESETGIRKLRHRTNRNNSGWQLSGSGLLTHYNIRPVETIRYKPVKEEALLVISLNTEESDEH